MFISRIRTTLPAFLLLAAAGLAAEDVKPEAILDKFIEATGGRAAYDKIKSETATGTFELTSMGLTGNLTSYKSAPNMAYTVIEFEGVGKAEQGSDGKIAWSINPGEGPRVKEGDELAAELRNDAIHPETRWKEFYKKVELAGTEDVDGKPCYKLVMTPNEGGAETRYYDKSSNLLVKMVMPVTTPQGALTVESILSDYRDEGGLLVAHTVSQKIPSMEFLVKIKSIKYNEDIPASRFALPDEIKALVDKSAKTDKDAKTEKK